MKNLKKIKEIEEEKVNSDENVRSLELKCKKLYGSLDEKNKEIECLKFGLIEFGGDGFLNKTDKICSGEENKRKSSEEKSKEVARILMEIGEKVVKKKNEKNKNEENNEENFNKNMEVDVKGWKKAK